MAVRLSRLDHFAIPVADLDRAERFYTGTLGMERVMRLPDQSLLRLGGQNVGLMRVEALPPVDRSLVENPLGKPHHAFLVEDEETLLSARETLLRAGTAVSDLVNWGDHRCFYFLDPDGNLLEIVTPPRRD